MSKETAKPATADEVSPAQVASLPAELFLPMAVEDGAGKELRRSRRSSTKRSASDDLPADTNSSKLPVVECHNCKKSFLQTKKKGRTCPLSNCVKCDKEFTRNLFEKVTMCKACTKEKNVEKLRRTCIDCNETFLPQSYSPYGYKRCSSCLDDYLVE